MNKTLKLSAIIGVLVCICSYHLYCAGKFYFLTDDAFISFRYLDNWLSGQGLVYNPGERVEGYTNFLWIALLSVPRIFGLAAETSAAALGIISSLALLLVVFFTPRIALAERSVSWWWLLGPFFLASTRTYGVWTTGGLETRLFSLLVYLGALLSFRAATKTGTKDAMWAGLAFGLSELCRPEGLMFFATAAFLVVAAGTVSKKSGVSRYAIAGVLIFFLLTGSHYILRHVYYGAWLPNTFYAKVGGSRLSLGLVYLGMFGLEYALYFWAVPLVLHIRRGIRLRDIFLCFFLLFCLPYLLYVAYIGGDHFEYRFLDPVLPIIAVVISRGLAQWVKAKGALNMGRFAAAALFVIVFIVYEQALPFSSGMAFSGEYRSGVAPEIDASRTRFRLAPGFGALAGIYNKGYKTLVENFSAIRYEEHKAFRLQQEELGLAFKRFVDNGWFDKNDLFCMPSIGALPYYSGIRVIDFHGLTDPVIARTERGKAGKLFHEKRPSEEYMEKRGVAFILNAGSLFSANDSPGIPWINSEQAGLDLSRWTDRRYIMRLEDLYIMFFSTLEPESLMRRLYSRGVRVFVYVPYKESLCRPVELREWLHGR